MSREYTTDWVTWNSRNWPALCKPLAGRPGLSFLEIGSYEGRSACWWLENVLTDRSSSLVCIDPWNDPVLEGRFDRNVADTGRSPQVRKLKGFSRDRLVEVPDATLDFAYVDGSHAVPDVLLDGLLVLPKVKSGGLILFDDYELNEGPGACPKPGIDTFLHVAAEQIEEVLRCWQVAVRRK